MSRGLLRELPRLYDRTFWVSSSLLELWAVFPRFSQSQFRVSSKQTLSWVKMWACLTFQSGQFSIQNWNIYIYIHSSTGFVRTAIFFCQIFPLVVHSCIAQQYVLPCQLQSVYCYALWSHSLKASWVIECLSGISSCPSSFISYAAGLLSSSDTCECLHMLTACLCYLQCTQTARAELKHINHSRCLQLNYKDTQFLLCLIMRGLL